MQSIKISAVPAMAPTARLPSRRSVRTQSVAEPKMKDGFEMMRE